MQSCRYSGRRRRAVFKEKQTTSSASVELIVEHVPSLSLSLSAQSRRTRLIGLEHLLSYLHSAAHLFPKRSLARLPGAQVGVAKPGLPVKISRL